MSQDGYEQAIGVSLDHQLRLWLDLAKRAEAADPAVTGPLLDRVRELRCLVDLVEEVDRPTEPQLSDRLHRLYRWGLVEVVARIKQGEHTSACRLTARLLELLIVETRWLRPDRPAPLDAA